MRQLNNLKLLLTISALFFIAVVILAVATELWVILSIGVGFLFGFALQKGDLCGSSAMSEVIIMRDSKKLFGFWIAILTSMILFAIFESLGVIQLAPKKLIWLSALVGGLIFGVGTVLGGGCISGCMYKGATGNINSIAALLTIPIGISFADFGPLEGFNKFLLSFVINGENDNAITLHSLLGLPYWLLVLMFFLLTIVLIYINSKKKTRTKNTIKDKFQFNKIFTKSWKPWQTGIAIGVIAMLAWLSSLPVGRNYPLGVTHGVNHIYQAIVDNNVRFIYQKPQPKAQTNINSTITYIQTKSAQIPSVAVPKYEPKKPSQILIAALGGFLIGVGAGIATGCIIGNILSAWAMFSVGMLIFGVATLLANWATAYFYLMGGKLFNK